MNIYNFKIDWAEYFLLSSGAIVTLTRGDSFQAPVFINMGTKLDPIQYILDTDDKLYFAIMEPNQSFEQAILKKVFTDESDTDEYGNTLITLTPDDTEYLHPGTYYYSAKLYRTETIENLDGTTTTKEYVNTIIDKTLFYIVE